MCGRNELEICTTLEYPHHFIPYYASVYTQAHAHMLFQTIWGQWTNGLPVSDTNKEVWHKLDVSLVLRTEIYHEACCKCAVCLQVDMKRTLYRKEWSFYKCGLIEWWSIPSSVAPTFFYTSSPAPMKRWSSQNLCSLSICGVDLLLWI